VNAVEGEIYIADGNSVLSVLANVTDAATHKPVVGATLTAIRAGRGTTLLPTDSTAMPPPAATNARGHALLHANFRWAGSQAGSSVFVEQSFLRVQAPGFRSTDVPISAIGRLDYPPKTMQPRVTVSVALVHE
jgi:hypothetical protein